MGVVGRRARRLAAGLALAAAFGCGGELRPRHVVLVSLDAVGAGHVGAYGYQRDTTPQLDAIARAGTLFESAWSPQTWTLTSHLTLLTGLDPAVHGASRERAASPGARSVAQVMRDAGFATAAFVGERVWMHPRFGHGAGFDRYEVGSDDASENMPAILDWLDQQARAAEEDAGHRFFLFAHFYDAHSDGKGATPYAVPDPENRRFLPEGAVWGRRGGTSLLLSLRRGGNATERDREFLNAFYDAGVRWADDHGLRPIVRALREHGLEDDTLLVVTADHGEEIFDHGGVLHGQPYVETARVPLVMRGPGVPAGRRVEALVGLVDVAPTLLAQAGLPGVPAMQGVDLSSLLQDDAPVRDAVFVDGLYEGDRTWGSSVVVDRDGERWSYVAKVDARGPLGRRVFDVTGEEELYALARDPLQRDDVSAAEPETTAALRRRLLAWYRANESRAQGAARARGGPLVSAEEAARLEALGYYASPSESDESSR